MATPTNLGSADANPEKNPLLQQFLDDLDALHQMQSGMGSISGGQALSPTAATSNPPTDKIAVAKAASEARILAAVNVGSATIAQAEAAGADHIAKAKAAGAARIATAEKAAADNLTTAKTAAATKLAGTEETAASKKPTSGKPAKASTMTPQAHTPKPPPRATAHPEAAVEAERAPMRKAVSKAKRSAGKGGGFSAGLKKFLGETTKTEAVGNVATTVLEGVKAVNDDLVGESLGLGEVHAAGIESTNRTNQLMGMKGPGAVEAAKEDYENSAAELAALKAKRGTFTQGASTPLGQLKEGLKARGMKSWTGGFLPRVTGGWIADDTLTTDNEMADKKLDESIKSKEVGLALKKKNYEQQAKAAKVPVGSLEAKGHAAASASGSATAAAERGTHGGGECGCCKGCGGGEGGKGMGEAVAKGLEALHETVKKGHAAAHRTQKRRKFARS